MFLISNGDLREVQIGQELTIGRAYSNLLRLEGEEISRVHGIIYRRGTDFVIRDLDSKNGILVNGQNVVTTLVAPGDEIQIGNYLMVFDPAPDYDMTGFMRRHNVSPDGQDQPRQSSDDKNEDTLDSVVLSARKHGEPSRRAPESTTQVFFNLHEIDTMTQSDFLPASTKFINDLMRMHRQLNAFWNGEDTDEEGGLYHHFLAAAVAATGADRGVIVLKDDVTEVLRLGAIMPRDRDVAVNRVVLKAVLREHQAVMCNDAQRDERFLKTSTVIKEHIGSLIAHPIMRGDVPIGLIYADVTERTNAFRRDHLLILHLLTRLLVLCLRRPVTRR